MSLRRMAVQFGALLTMCIGARLIVRALSRDWARGSRALIALGGSVD